MLRRTSLLPMVQRKWQSLLKSSSGATWTRYSKPRYLSMQRSAVWLGNCKNHGPRCVWLDLKISLFKLSWVQSPLALQVISRAVYKGAMQKTMDKVMRSHPDATDARFLIREGDKIRKLLTQYVDYISGQQGS